MKRRERTDDELEQLFFLGVCVAGKQAKVIQAKIRAFLGDRTGLFAYIRGLMDEDRFEQRLREVKMGKYRVITQCFSRLFDRGLDLRTCSIEDLEELPGIGPKTSRFFVAYSRPDARVAVLDVHILSFLREQGIDAPRQTPQSRKRYAELEGEFLALAEKFEVDPTMLDDFIWQKKAKGWQDGS